MTVAATVPELVVAPEIADWIAGRCADADALVDIERAVFSGTVEDGFMACEPWIAFQKQALALWKAHDHLIVRGLSTVRNEGASLILVALLLSRRFKSYRGNNIVKHFRMSPWTTALSHTLQEGQFHTDINTSSEPPLITAIQCRCPDPGAPAYGEVRVARLSDLLQALYRSGAVRTLDFLLRTDVTMVNDSSPAAWTGRIVNEGIIRFHPETLRAAQRRYNNQTSDLEDQLRIIKAASLSVSTPIQLGAGDTLLVSNTRALHYRGACSVTYESFPLSFTSREVHVLHLLDEPV